MNINNIKHNAINFLRWCGIIPGAVIVPIVGCTIFVALWLIGDLFSGELWLYIEHPEILPVDHLFTSFGIAALFGALTIIGGTKVAPTHKRIVAFSLFGIVAIVFGSLLIMTLIFIGFADAWRFIINLVIIILAYGFKAFIIMDKYFC